MTVGGTEITRGTRCGFFVGSAEERSRRPTKLSGQGMPGAFVTRLESRASRGTADAGNVGTTNFS